MSGFEKLDDELGNPEEEKRLLEELRAREAQERARKTATRKAARARKTFEERIPKISHPTERQKQTLEKFGVEPLPTGYLCSNLIAYILRGNGAEPGGLNPFQRAAYFNRVQQEWKGKKVAYFKQRGVVRYIFPKAKERVLKEIKENRKVLPSAFLATVAFGEDENALSAHHVEIKELEKAEAEKES